MEKDSPPATGEQHPAGEQLRGGDDWRADALARSRHSRLDAEVRPPEESFDEARAEALCAELCRNLLGDFAPALLLLDGAARRRAQCLAAHAGTLFDFARQHGVEGERLAQINRWEFALESALSGEPVGQPIFVALAREHRLRPWPPDALDEIAAAARRRATRSRPATPEVADADALRLARAVATALLAPPPQGEGPGGPGPEVDALGGALLRLAVLQNLGSEVAGRRWPLPVSELPAGELGADPEPAHVVAAVKRECERLRPRLLGAPRGLVALPVPYRRAAMFALLAGVRLLATIEGADADLLVRAPRIGLLSRLALLARARWWR